MPGWTSSQSCEQSRNPATQYGQAMEPAMATDADTDQAIALVMPGETFAAPAPAAAMPVSRHA